MKKIRRFITGALFIILIFVIFGGSNGLFFLMLSVICTFGLTLIIYVPLAYAVGTGLEKVYYSISGVSNEEKIDIADNTTNAISSLGLGDQSLVKYIKEARSAGMDDEIIKWNLYEHGWKAAQVEKVFEIMKNYT